MAARRQSLAARPSLTHAVTDRVARLLGAWGTCVWILFPDSRQHAFSHGSVRRNFSPHAPVCTRAHAASAAASRSPDGRRPDRARDTTSGMPPSAAPTTRTPARPRVTRHGPAPRRARWWCPRLGAGRKAATRRRERRGPHAPRSSRAAVLFALTEHAGATHRNGCILPGARTVMGMRRGFPCSGALALI